MTVTRAWALTRRSHSNIFTNPSGTGAEQSGFDGAGIVLMGEAPNGNKSRNGAALGVAFVALGVLVLWLVVGP